MSAFDWAGRQGEIGGGERLQAAERDIEVRREFVAGEVGLDPGDIVRRILLVANLRAGAAERRGSDEGEILHSPAADSLRRYG